MIQQTPSVQAKHAPLLGIFLNGYENMRQKMDAPCRRPLLEIAPLVVSFWRAISGSLSRWQAVS